MCASELSRAAVWCAEICSAVADFHSRLAPGSARLAERPAWPSGRLWNTSRINYGKLGKQSKRKCQVSLAPCCGSTVVAGQRLQPREATVVKIRFCTCACGRYAQPGGGFGDRAVAWWNLTPGQALARVMSGGPGTRRPLMPKSASRIRAATRQPLGSGAIVGNDAEDSRLHAKRTSGVGITNLPTRREKCCARS